MSIGVIGLGYVGLPLAVTFAEAGEEVVGFEVSSLVLDGLAAGHSHVEDIEATRLQAVLPRLQLTGDPAALSACDALIVCVPTPLTRNREPDLRPLQAAADTLSGVVRAGQLVVLESTTFPGTTREELVPRLESSGLMAGDDLAIAFSPERVDPGRTDYDLRTTPKVVGGLTQACTERAVEMYSTICDKIVPVSTPEVAELSKLLENVFRAVNIALVNEMAVLADRMGIPIWEVIDAAATKPYGFMRFDPGPGMGGHCLPVDPFYLAWRAREFDMGTEFIELAGKVNVQMPYYCVERVERLLNEDGKAVRGADVLVLGAAYKAGVGDLRESPGLKIIDLLLAKGANVRYHDPHVAELPGSKLRSVPLPAGPADIAVLVTAHPTVDNVLALSSARRGLDLRGSTRALAIDTVSQL